MFLPISLLKCHLWPRLYKVLHKNYNYKKKISFNNAFIMDYLIWYIFISYCITHWRCSGISVFSFFSFRTLERSGSEKNGLVSFSPLHDRAIGNVNLHIGIYLTLTDMFQAGTMSFFGEVRHSGCNIPYKSSGQACFLWHQGTNNNNKKTLWKLYLSPGILHVNCLNHIFPPMSVSSQVCVTKEHLQSHFYLGWEHKKEQGDGFKFTSSSSLILVTCISVQTEVFLPYWKKTKQVEMQQNRWRCNQHLLHQQARCFNSLFSTFIFHSLCVMIHLRWTSLSNH